MNLNFDPKLLYIHTFLFLLNIKTLLLVLCCDISSEPVSNSLPMMHYIHYCVVLIHRDGEKQRYSQPWITQNLKRLSRRKHRAYNRYLSTHSARDHATYKQIKNETLQGAVPRICKRYYHGWEPQAKTSMEFHQEQTHGLLWRSIIEERRHRIQWRKGEGSQFT